MLPLIYTNTISAGVFVMACLIWLVPEALGMRPQMAKASRKSASIQDRSSLVILITLQWVGLALSFWLGWSFTTGAIAWQRTTFFLLGILLIIIGVAWRWYAIWTLGRYFTRDVAVSAEQQIIQSGPYRLIRHPAYSGTFITMLGVGLAMTNWASLVALLICVFIGHFYRVKVEERALILAIGQPYIDYMQHTRRFIPLVF